MKKLFLILSVICLLGISNVEAKNWHMPDVSDHEKIKLHIFYGNGCEVCHDLLNFLNDNYDMLKDYIDIRGYEVWDNKDNNDFMGEVVDLLVPKSEEIGVPFTVIGGEYLFGFDEDKLMELIKNSYIDDGYNDQNFALIKDSTGQNYVEDSFDKMLVNSLIKDPDSKMPGWLTISIIVVILFGGIGILFYLVYKK